MNKPVVFLVLSAVSFLVISYAASSGFTQTPNAGEKTTATGCLQKGDAAGEFSIAGKDGKTHELRSSSVDLSKHLGHKVTIAGTLKAEKKEGQSQEYEPKDKGGDIQVTSLKMISGTCK